MSNQSKVPFDPRGIRVGALRRIRQYTIDIAVKKVAIVKKHRPGSTYAVRGAKDLAAALQRIYAIDKEIEARGSEIAEEPELEDVAALIDIAAKELLSVEGEEDIDDLIKVHVRAILKQSD